MSNLTCSAAQKLMSSFIDSMVTQQQAERLEAHVAYCEPCRRQLQSYISMRSLMARIETPAAPEDMVLETRVRLSQERNKNALVRLENRLNYLLKPMVVPAVLGVCLTMLFFGVLLGSMASSSTVLAQDRLTEEPVLGLFKPVHTTDPNWTRFAENDNRDLDEPLTIETYVGNEGQVLDYEVLCSWRGKQWTCPTGSDVPDSIRQMLSLAHFTPATSFGKPVESRIILSFIAVRN
ncbi:MAG TPA: zf-HC2 domain-containing protein [Terriglobia bacterium]|nr:zf-HC2 domain-containing protein [Terriglobia bacterium]